MKPSLAQAYSKQKSDQHRKKMWLGGEVGNQPDQDEYDSRTGGSSFKNGKVTIPNDSVLDIDKEDFDEGPSVSPANSVQHFAEGGEVGTLDDGDSDDADFPTNHTGGLDVEKRDEEEENKKSGTAFNPAQGLAKGGFAQAVKRRRGY